MLEGILTNARILIVDDQKVNNILLETILEQNGYPHFKSLTDSRQVLETYAEYQPDLILLDLMMPYLDGFAVMEQLSSVIPADTYLPILVLTADATPEAKRRALSSGAKDFLTKPLDAVEVILRVKNLLEARFLHLQMQNQNQILEEQVRKRTAQLAESETKHRILIEQIPAITYIDNPVIGPGETQFVSRQIEGILGITPKEWIEGGIDLWLQTIHPEDRKRTLAEYMRHYQSGEPFNFEYRFVARDGRTIWIRDTASVLRDEAGKPSQIHGIMLDLTERKLAEEALQATTQLMETIFDNTHILLAYLDPQFNFVRVNHAYAAADEREPSFFPNHNHFDLYPDEENRKIFQKVVDTGEAHFAYAKPFKYAEHPERGETYWDWSLAPIKGADGKVKGLTLALLNVTERIKAEETLRLQSAAMNAADNIILITDERGVIQWVNPAFTTQTGYSAAEAIGQKPSILKSGMHDAAFYKDMWHTILAGQTWE
ncbi:MAG: PAS domain S-box protein, partial [Anaerolineales bacterium]|nr:PAS domain S-box protein [Anaerolineales bacterium]